MSEQVSCKICPEMVVLPVGIAPGHPMLRRLSAEQFRSMLRTWSVSEIKFADLDRWGLFDLVQSALLSIVQTNPGYMIQVPIGNLGPLQCPMCTRQVCGWHYKICSRCQLPACSGCLVPSDESLLQLVCRRCLVSM